MLGPYRLPPVAPADLVPNSPASPDVPSAPLSAELPRSSTRREVVYQRRSYDDVAIAAAAANWADILKYYPDSNAQAAQSAAMVRSGFDLARSGALYAAEQKFVAALRHVAQARDATTATSRHAEALAAGQTALSEAAEFEPTAAASRVHGVQVVSIAEAHQTPVLTEVDITKLTAHEAIALYHRYAERKFATAVAGDPAGSMALYGLGKVYAERAAREGDPAALQRTSLSMYEAAAIVRPDNPLAANELGVSLARSGRYAHAHSHLVRAVQLAPVASHHHNLAVVEQRLGRNEVARQLQATADQLARRELASGQVAQRHGVAWVSPQEFNRTSDAAPVDSTPRAAPPHVAASADSSDSSPPQSRGSWWSDVFRNRETPATQSTTAKPALARQNGPQPTFPMQR
jgi:tetratricopeptide (TPR) repeat protein